MIGFTSIGNGKIKIDSSMQKLHDEGKWEWKIKRIIENYHNVEGHNTDISTTQGLQYVFKTAGN